MSANRIDPAELDLLVDGELDERRRRAVLMALEASPDGWRQCALAFLEAQAWQQSLPTLVDAGPAQETLARAGRSLGGRGLAALALAASLLIGMVLGARLVPSGSPAEKTPAAGASVAGPLADGPQRSAAGPTSEPAPPPLVADQQPLALSDDVLAMVLDTKDGQRQRLEMPMFPAPERWQLAAWIWPPAAAEHVDWLREAEHSGFLVETRRMLAPLRLEGRGSVVFPVEELRFVPVSRETY